MTSPKTIITLLGLGAILGVACGEARLPQFTGDALDPDVYRAQIVAIDAVLFEDGPLGEPERDAVSSTLLTLGRFAATDTSNTIATTLGQNMRMLSALAKRTKVGTPLANSTLRREWIRIRGSLFADAWWFRQSSNDPVMSAR